MMTKEEEEGKEEGDDPSKKGLENCRVRSIKKMREAKPLWRRSYVGERKREKMKTGTNLDQIG